MDDASVSRVRGSHTDVADQPERFDRVTIALHWITALLVVYQFGVAQVWDLFERPTRSLLFVSHQSFGMVLAAVIVLRLLWRFTGKRDLPPADTGWMKHAAQIAHAALYVLLVTVVALGIATRWTAGRTVNVFGFLINSPIAAWSRDAAETVSEFHSVVAWAIIVIATVHALAALTHHYLWRDGVLARMLPGVAR
jgi:cytochrome b561